MFYGYTLPMQDSTEKVAIYSYKTQGHGDFVACSQQDRQTDNRENCQGFGSLPFGVKMLFWLRKGIDTK